ncbi:MAG: hypothetical protein U9R39_09250 [Campylobacterota bacterium]|nr:hypothetical protein [Campylobacterota bacterium]
MKYIYIKNYLLIPREDKLEFFKFLGVFKSFKAIKQKIVLDENSLLLEFEDNPDIKLARESIEKFFANNDDVDISIIKDIVKDKNEFILIWEDDTQKRIKL